MKKNILNIRNLMLVFAVLMIFGCTETSPDVSDTTPPDTAPTVPTAEGVTRVITPENANVGDIVNVKLYINLGADKTYYVAEEIVPMELEVLDKEADKENHLKMINIQNPVSKVYEYNVKANLPGSLTFSGVYAFDGIEDPVQIMGQDSLRVQ